MDAELILQIVAYVLAGLFFILSMLLQWRSGKLSKESALKTVLEKLPEFVTSAERIFGSKTGEAKKKYVLNLLEAECMRLKMTINDELESTLSEQVEQVLEAPQKKETSKEEV